MLEVLTEELQKAQDARDVALEKWRGARGMGEEVEGAMAQAPNVDVDSLLLPRSLPSDSTTIS